MPWATCLKSTETGKMMLVTPDQRPDSDDPRYEQEVHIVPVVTDPKDENYYTFGVHDFTHNCYCHPKIQEQVHGRTLILHREVVN